MAHASTRISIAWPPAPASEPTDTLVLGVGEYYVDLRITKSDLSIDWSMAGKRIQLSENPTKIRFTHAIDSRGSYGPDEGIFTKLPNNDDLETGSMPAPHLGNKISPYEEIWRDYPSPRKGNVSWILQSVEDEGRDGGKTFLGRIGVYFLALREHEMGFGALRVECQGDGEDGKWKRKYGVGFLEGLPDISVEGMDVLRGNEVWKVGEEVEVGGVKFIVRGFEKEE